jgi:MFS family permease
MPHPVRSLNPFRVLVTHRNFRLFWIGQTLSLIGTWMQQMALGWLALELSNSAFQVGLVASLGSLPILLLSLPAGALVDRRDKLRLVKIAQSLLLVEATALWLLTWTGHVTIGWLIGLAVFAGAVSAVEIPARQSLMIELVGRDDLHAAIALNSTGFNLARIFGPAVGAAIIASLGIAWCFGLNALSYLTVLYGLFRVALPPWSAPSLEATPWRGVKDGLRYMRNTPRILALIELITVFSILGVPYLTLMPVVARDLLKTGAGGYGVLLSCVGIGGVAGALALASVAAHVPRGRVLVFASYSFATVLLLFSLVRSAALAYPILLVAGFSMIVNNAAANGLMQTLAPDEFRGRLMSVYSLVVVGLPQVVGSFAAGAVAHAVGVDWAIGGAAALMLAYGWWAFRQHRSWLMAEA